MKNRLWTAFVLVLPVCGCGSGDGNGSDESIVIGSVMIDDIDEKSRLELIGVRMAIDEINQAGVFAHPLQLVNLTASQGDAPSEEKAVQAVELLHDREQAIGFISNFGGNQVIPMIARTNTPEYQDFVQCNYQAVDGGVNIPGMTGSDVNDTFYRTVVTTQRHLDVGAKVIIDGGKKNLGLIRFNDSFGQEVSLGVRLKIGELPAGTMSLVFDNPVPTGPFDLETHRDMLDEVIGYSTTAEVDVVVLAVFQAQAPAIVKYLTENGYAGWLFLTLASKTYDMFDIATNITSWQTVPGNLIIGVEGDNLQGQNSEVFISNFSAYTTEELANHASTGYDCTYAIAFSLLYAGGDPLPAQVKAGMPEFKDVNRTADEVEIGLGAEEFTRAAGIIASGGRIDFQGASGRLLFDENGDRPSQGMASFGPNDTGTGWEVKTRYDEDLNPID